MKRGEILLKTLDVVAQGAAITASLAVPNTAVALAPLIADRSSIEQNQAYRSLRYAWSRGWLVMRELPDGDIELGLSRSGKYKYQKLYLDQPLTGTPGKWRIVIYDIPNTRKRQRDAFRASLKRLGFSRLQESVWVTTYECSAQIQALTELYGISRWVQLLESSNLDVAAQQNSIALSK